MKISQHNHTSMGLNIIYFLTRSGHMRNYIKRILYIILCACRNGKERAR